MSQVLLVVDRIEDWAPYYPSDQVMTFDQYFHYQASNKQRTRVINLCRDLSYLDVGYYCSLLAEARGHRVIPSVATITTLQRKTLYAEELPELNAALRRDLEKLAQTPRTAFTQRTSTPRRFRFIHG